MKTICIYHSRDLDGWMSAAIVKKWFSENNENVITVNINKLTDNDIYSDSKYNKKDNLLYMLGWDYGDDIPNLDEYDKVIMCDVSFDGKSIQELLERNNLELIYIDHHISAITDIFGNEMVENGRYKNDYIKGLRDIKFAACELTWKYFYTHETIPEIVRLLGRYDCFGHKGTDEEQEVLQFQYGARSRMSNYEDCYKYLESAIKDGTFSKFDSKSSITQIIFMLGEAIYEYLCTEAKQTYAKSFPIKFVRVAGSKANGEESSGYSYNFLCINQERFNPINFGIDYHNYEYYYPMEANTTAIKGFDGYACYWYKDGKWTWSLYNDNGLVDCSIIAKSFGGGGHKGAAGFVCDDKTMLNIINK